MTKQQTIPAWAVTGQPVQYLKWTGEWRPGTFVRTAKTGDGRTVYMIAQEDGRNGLFERDQVREGSTD